MIKTILKTYAIDRVVSSILDSMIATFSPSSEPFMGLMIGMDVIVTYRDYDGDSGMVCGTVTCLADSDGDLELDLNMRNNYDMSNGEDLWWVRYEDIIKWELLVDVLGRCPEVWQPYTMADCDHIVSTNCGMND